MNLPMSQRILFRDTLFPFVRKFMDKRIDSYLSLFYECETYTMEELCSDLVEVLRTKQPFSVMPVFDRKPIPTYVQLTLF